MAKFNLVLIRILECDVMATPFESLGKLGGTILMRALIFVSKLSSTSFHKVMASQHVFTRATTRAGVQVALSPLSNSGDD